MSKRSHPPSKAMVYLMYVLLVTITMCLAVSPRAEAFKTGAHWALASSVSQSLPSGNRIKTAMLAQPDCLAWGCVGPDLAASLPGIALNRTGWFDAYHYHSVAAFCRQLMKDALASNDDRQISFAAGWITHIAGDMAVHGLLVNPEAGVYIDQFSDHDLHSNLEGWADPVVWSDLAGLPIKDYAVYTGSSAANEASKLYRHFTSGPNGVLTVPADGCLEKLLNKVNQEVILGNGNEHFTFLENTNEFKTPGQYGDYFGPENMKLAESIFAKVMAYPQAVSGLVEIIRSKAKMYQPLQASQSALAISGTAFHGGSAITETRKNRLRSAWIQSNNAARMLLEGAARGDFSLYSDSWVADAGLNDGRAIGSLRLVIITGGGFKNPLDGGGTNHSPYFGMQWDDGTIREWKLETNGYDDFEAGDRDVYYLHCYDSLPIWRVKKIWIRLEKYSSDLPDLPWWNLQAFNVYVNDRCVYWLTSWDHWTEFGSSREAFWDRGNGLDPMLEHGWPNGPDPSLTMGPNIFANNPTGNSKQLVVGRNADGRLEVFSIGMNEMVYHNAQVKPNGNWGGESTMGGWAKQFTVGRNADGRLEIFYVGTNDKIYHNYQLKPNDNWSGESAMGGSAKQLAVGQNADGRLEIFYVGTNDKIYHNAQVKPNSNWGGEAAMGGLAKQLVVGQNADGRLEIFYVGTDNKIYHNAQVKPNGNWGGEAALGGSAKQLVVGRNADGRLEIFYIGTDDKLYHNAQVKPNGNWGGEAALGGSAKQLAVGQNADGRLEIFYVGTNDKLYHNYQVKPNSNWSGESAMGGSAKQLVVGQNADGRLEIFYVGTNDKIYHNAQVKPNSDWGGEISL